MSSWFYLELYTENPTGIRMKSYVPDYLTRNNLLFNNIYDAEGYEFDSLYYGVDNLLNQAFVESATWGLNKWEEFLGIIIDESKLYEVRRNNIKSKLSGINTVTVDLIKTVVERYKVGNVIITEYTDEYSFEITFSNYEAVQILKDIKNAVDLIKPAHLCVTYRFPEIYPSEILFPNNSLISY